MADAERPRMAYSVWRVYVFSLFLCVSSIIGQVQGTSPDAMFKRAAADLINIRSEDKPYTRYLSLQAVPEADREKFISAMIGTLNSTSFKSRFHKPALIDNSFLRIDLRELGWDRNFRLQRLAIFRQQGVTFSFADNAAQERFLDIWETFAFHDPYFLVTQEYNYKTIRGWIDPTVENAVRKLSYSSKFIVRADWLLSKLLVEKQQGGFYSQVMMFPPKESDLYKIFGVNIRLVEQDDLLKHGGSVLKSIVAHNNRELQMIPSAYGFDYLYIWRTFDVNKDNINEKSVIDSLRGTLKHNGREIIGSLPNGLNWYYLADNVGNQVAVVPPDIALDMRPDKDGNRIRDRNVHNAYKCIDCHMPQKGIYPFDDVISKAVLNPRIQLRVITNKPYSTLDAALQEYYLSDLGKRITNQQESYAERIKECTGITPEELSDSIVGNFNRYVWELVTPEQAAKEMGSDLNEARAFWLFSGNNQLAVLGSGQPIRRGAWESSFKDALRVPTYSWENSLASPKAKK